MNDKILLDIIDGLRDELNIAKEQIKENKKLKEELRNVNRDYKHDINVCYEFDDKHIKIIDDLKVENEELKAENCGLINESKWDKNKMIKELQAENESLQDQLKDAVNDYEELLNSPNVK